MPGNTAERDIPQIADHRRKLVNLLEEHAASTGQSVLVRSHAFEDYREYLKELQRVKVRINARETNNNLHMLAKKGSSAYLVSNAHRYGFFQNEDLGLEELEMKPSMCRMSFTCSQHERQNAQELLHQEFAPALQLTLTNHFSKSTLPSKMLCTKLRVMHLILE